MKIYNIIVYVLILFLLIGCTKKASIEITSYEALMKKINNNETFVLAIINDSDNKYKSFNNSLKKIVKNYNINITYLNTNKLNNKQINKIKSIINYNTTPTLVFLNNGMEENTNNRIIGDISVDRMIEIFKASGYID